MKIIGLSGTNGSGKDTVATLLAGSYGYLNVSATDLLVEELNRRGWPIDREHKSKLSAEWRRESGMAVIVDKAVEMFKFRQDIPAGLVVGSLRHPGEADRIHELGGQVIWVDADPKTRYARIQANLHERAGTHAEHGLSFEAFLAEERREMSPAGDHATLDMGAVKERADVILMNDAGLEDFKQQVTKALKLS